MYSTYLGGNVISITYSIAVDSSGNTFVSGSTNSTNFPTLNAFQNAKVGNDFNTFDIFVAKLNASGALVYFTYLGGSGDEEATAIAINSSGTAFVTGDTKSTNFPTLAAYQSTYGGGNYDAFVTKLNPAGNALVYSTYLGGSGNDYGVNITIDGSGNAFVIGATTSTNFPIQNASQSTNAGNSDAFVTKLNPAGNALVFSTYLGGSGNDYGNGIAVDSSGNILVTGYTASTNFPTLNDSQNTNGGGYDTFIAKFGSQTQNNPNNIVTVAVDDGSTGTLSFVIARATTANGGIITFAVGITTITFQAGHAPLPALNPGVNLQGVCGNSGPQITIDGSGMSGIGLTLAGNNQVSGVTIMVPGNRTRNRDSLR